MELSQLNTEFTIPASTSSQMPWLAYFQSLWNGLAMPEKHLSQVFAEIKKSVGQRVPATAQHCVVDAIPAVVHDQRQVINQHLPNSFAL